MITEEMLIAAAGEVNDALLNTLPEDVCRYTPSPRFARRMKKIIRRGSHPALYRVTHQAACFAMVIILSFMMMFAWSPAIRAAVVDWIREQFPFFDQYSYMGASEFEPERKQYELTYVPAEYTEILRREKNTNTTVRYMDYSTEKLIHFAYTQQKDSIFFVFKKEDYVHTHISSDIMQADFYESPNNEKTSVLIWTYQECDVLFCIIADLPEQELIKIAENVKEIF